jgi:hypothetical protein
MTATAGILNTAERSPAGDWHTESPSFPCPSSAEGFAFSEVTRDG